MSQASLQRFGAAGRRRKTIGWCLGPAAAIVVFLLPLPSLSLEAHRLAAVVSLVVLWWITEAIPLPVTAVLGSALCVVPRCMMRIIDRPRESG